MKLHTKAQLAALTNNHANRDNTGHDPKPVVKLFTPWAGATWLITELDPDTDIAFGLCDLGQGTPELGYVSLTELRELRGPMGLKVERDLHFTPTKTLSEYADEARLKSQIVA